MDPQEHQPPERPQPAAREEDQTQEVPRPQSSPEETAPALEPGIRVDRAHPAEPTRPISTQEGPSGPAPTQPLHRPAQPEPERGPQPGVWPMGPGTYPPGPAHPQGPSRQQPPPQPFPQGPTPPPLGGPVPYQQQYPLGGPTPVPHDQGSLRHPGQQSPPGQPPGTPQDAAPSGPIEPAKPGDPHRSVDPDDLAAARKRLDLARWLHLIDAEEHAGRCAALEHVHTLGELDGVLDEIPSQADLEERRAAYVPAPVQPAGGFAIPGTTALLQSSAAPYRQGRRMPLTSPMRQEVPPPDVGIGPYGRQFERADPRVISHRMVPRAVFTPYGMQQQFVVHKETNSYAVVSLVLAIAGMFVCPPTALVAVVAGHWSLAQISLSDRALAQGTVVAIGEAPQSGRGVAIAGLIVGYLVIAFYILITIIAIANN